MTVWNRISHVYGVLISASGGEAAVASQNLYTPLFQMGPWDLWRLGGGRWMYPES